MTLSFVGQDDFGVGVLRGSASDAQAGVGLENAVNGLFNDDGDVYRRGGDRYVSDHFPEPLTFIWSGILNGAQASLVATPSHSYGAFAADPGYQIGPGIPLPVRPAVVRNTVYLPNGQKWTGAGNLAPWVAPASLSAGERHIAAAAGRLLVATGNRIAFSTAPPDAFAFNATDYHELPGGVVVIGMAAIQDTVFVFTDYGLWTIANLSFDLTDAQGNVQQTLQLITPEIGLWHESGLCEWEGRIVAPCMDTVYLIDGVNPPQPISASIASYYADLVRLQLRPGGAKVYGAHLFLPIISPDEIETQTLFVCRLSRPQRARYLYFPWSMFTGHAGLALMFESETANTEGAPILFGACSDGYIVDASHTITPEAGAPIDADDSAYEFDVETRDFPTGNGQPNHIRQIRMRYTVEPGFDPVDTVVTAGYSAGPEGDYWEGGIPGSATRPWVQLGDVTLPAPGYDPAVWRLPTATRARYARLRFRTTSAPQMLTIHRVDMGVRPSTHQR